MYFMQIRYSVNVATKNMEFRTSNQAIYIIYEQPATVILHDIREICLYRFLCGAGVLSASNLFAYENIIFISMV